MFDVAADLPQHGHQTLDRPGAASELWRVWGWQERGQIDHFASLVDLVRHTSFEANCSATLSHRLKRTNLDCRSSPVFLKQEQN